MIIVWGRETKKLKWRLNIDSQQKYDKWEKTMHASTWIIIYNNSLEVDRKK